jgi:hypothetical protein
MWDYVIALLFVIHGLIIPAQSIPIHGLIIPAQSIPAASVLGGHNYQASTVREWQRAKAKAGTTKAIVKASQAGQKGSIIVTDQGSVLTLRSGSQFEAGETEFACGFFAGSVLKYATPPNVSNTGSWEDVDQFADAEYDNVYGSHDASQGGGISVPQLHTVFDDGGMNYQDIDAITPGSPQSSDIANIKAALRAGYPVVATITEASVNDLTGDIPAGNPYGWNPSGLTHVIVYVGIASDGNLLVWDYANVVGSQQGDNYVRPLPRKYESSSITNVFATVVQVVGDNTDDPWLKPIPSGDPLSWPDDFNAQNFGS